MPPSVDRCGTYAGWNLHQRHGTEPCEPCRQARTDYMRRYRAKEPEAYLTAKKHEALRSRALTVLANRHRDELLTIMADLRSGRPAS